MWKGDDFEWLFEIGSRIYFNVFENAPQLKRFFPYIYANGREQENWKESKGFRQQSLRLVQVIGNCVEMLQGSCCGHQDMIKSMRSLLLRVGHVHRLYSTRGFTASDWQHFRIAALEVLRSQLTRMSLFETESASAMAAWTKLINYIISTMEFGYVHDGF
ncbi:unnamed protein product [Soboliphyme baturini]|uniref:GLOBIN domain-containing protein n=1 Tax=Soboliphyme baturini TaxID=241478 RepID=A0A183J306_9BILA|nr:unnamed protein product [Soboliphyme baturini]